MGRSVPSSNTTLHCTTFLLLGSLWFLICDEAVWPLTPRALRRDRNLNILDPRRQIVDARPSTCGRDAIHPLSLSSPSRWRGRATRRDARDYRLKLVEVVKPTPKSRAAVTFYVRSRINYRTERPRRTAITFMQSAVYERAYAENIEMTLLSDEFWNARIRCVRSRRRYCHHSIFIVQT